MAEQTPAPSRTASPDFGPTLPDDVGPTFWSWLDAIHEELRSQTQAHAQPHFAAGWAGYWGYEMGGEALQGVGANADRSAGNETPPLDTHRMPDAHFGWCDAVLRFEHGTSEWVASALIEEAQAPADGAQLRSLQRALASVGLQRLGRSEAQATSWFDHMQARLDELADAAAEQAHCASTSLAPLSKLQARDSAPLYKAKVEAARQHILHGESYELCLTTQFLGTLEPLSDASHKDSDHFSLYCALRKRNPAPYAAYMLMAPPARGQRAQALLSTSPERFMSIDAAGNVEMKPIKGTLSRAGWADGEEQLRGAASAQWRVEEDERRKLRLAADAKERAENLMVRRVR
jgi:para-aminobenzoate synthetase